MYIYINIFISIYIYIFIYIYMYIYIFMVSVPRYAFTDGDEFRKLVRLPLSGNSALIRPASIGQ